MKRQIISLDQWYYQVEDRCRTMSGLFLPHHILTVHEYSPSYAEFLTMHVYPVRFVDALEGTRLVHWNHPLARPILLQDFAANPVFVRSLTDRLQSQVDSLVKEAELLVHHCAGCDRRIVVDGNHRAVSIFAQRNLDARIHVWEVSGYNWPTEMPDMSTVCACGTYSHTQYSMSQTETEDRTELAIYPPLTTFNRTQDRVKIPIKRLVVAVRSRFDMPSDQFDIMW